MSGMAAFTFVSPWLRITSSSAADCYELAEPGRSEPFRSLSQNVQRFAGVRVFVSSFLIPVQVKPLISPFRPQTSSPVLFIRNARVLVQVNDRDSLDVFPRLSSFGTILLFTLCGVPGGSRHGVYRRCRLEGGVLQPAQPLPFQEHEKVRLRAAASAGRDRPPGCYDGRGTRCFWSDLSWIRNSIPRWDHDFHGPTIRSDRFLGRQRPTFSTGLPSPNKRACCVTDSLIVALMECMA